MQFTDLRLRIIHFFKKNKKIILIVVLIWGMVILINYLLGHRKITPTATTTYEPHISVMNSDSSTPKAVANEIEEMIEKYVEYNKAGDFDLAFKMLTEDCRKYEFEDDINEFMYYLQDKVPDETTHYAIQDYSNIRLDGKKIYIYEIKYTEDMLATGLTNSEYGYTSEKLAFYRENNELKMCAGNFIYHSDVKSVSENDYLKIDIIDRTVNYSVESYSVKFTNRSNYTIVVADTAEENEISLILPNESRGASTLYDVVLKPGESMTADLFFDKFADDGDTSKSISFSSIRVMEQYSGVEDVAEETIQSEINNAIAKFSMQVTVDK